MSFKQKVYEAFDQSLADKIAGLQSQLNDLKESAANETKSTAGDKYETALAMLQMEQDNLRRQLQEMMELQSQLRSAGREASSAEIKRGSLIKTNKGWLLLSVAAGKIMVDSTGITSLSPSSPLGKLLMGKSAGDTVLMNTVDYKIQELL